ncbi:hypothetical protein [Fodinibius sp.]|uniref:hypothetical protein n=1 Tax=Fodinibius sp. TaxID=1872440 RepID=UPI002ACE8C29|nr:hypothetical protein [Fodinibius sp.]MDZ7658081.1 hypothetical protein [Fodinibius sp.]
MEHQLKYILGISVAIIALIGLNVYQYQNPKVVEVPEGTQQIDSTSWVQRSAYTDRGQIIDSLKAQNETLAEKVKESNDKIASYTAINGRLNLKVDSLKKQATWNAVTLDRMVDQAKEIQEDSADSSGVIRRSFTESRTFGNQLFRVTGTVDVELNPCGFTAEQIQMGLECPTDFFLRVRQDLQMSQLRDIRIDVASTYNDSRTRMLTYVTSPDFDSLDYRSYTELQPKNELPKFWIGAGVGVAVTLTGIILLN